MTQNQFDQSVQDEVRRKIREAEQLEDSKKEALWPSVETQEQYWQDHPDQEPPKPESMEQYDIR